MDEPPVDTARFCTDRTNDFYKVVKNHNISNTR